MPQSIRVAGSCPKCQAKSIDCRYNHFDRGDLVVDSWEHKCADCGWRETKAFRSDDPPESRHAQPNVCPLCGRQG